MDYSIILLEICKLLIGVVIGWCVGLKHMNWRWTYNSKSLTCPIIRDSKKYKVVDVTEINNMFIEYQKDGNILIKNLDIKESEYEEKYHKFGGNGVTSKL